MTSAAEPRDWLIDLDQKEHALQVILLKRMYVLPWTQFLYAEGTSEEVRAVFTTHDLVVKGSNLTSLLSDIATHQITVLKEPARTDKFTKNEGPRISELEVRRVEVGALE